jgi:two-component system chemotaxis response regulator CheY
MSSRLSVISIYNGGYVMRILIAEDDPTSRKFMQKFLSKYGECDVAVDGIETIDTFYAAMKEKKPYNLICLDIMMPRLDGLKALKTIRELEVQNSVPKDEKVKVIMTTALNDKQTVMSSYDTGCEAYAWKPIDMGKFVEVMRKLGLVE